MYSLSCNAPSLTYLKYLWYLWHIKKNSAQLSWCLAWQEIFARALFLHILFSWVKIDLYTGNWLPSMSGSAWKVWWLRVKRGQAKQYCLLWSFREELCYTTFGIMTISCETYTSMTEPLPPCDTHARRITLRLTMASPTLVQGPINKL